MWNKTADKFSISLSLESINHVVKEIDRYFEEHQVNRKEAIRLSFLMEEALLEYQELFGADQACEILFLDKKKSVVVKLVLVGISANPLISNRDEYLTTLLSFMRDAVKNTVKYSYKINQNVITCTASKETKETKETKQSKLLKNRVLIAFLAGLIIALCCRGLNPEMQDLLIASFVSPALKVLLGMLSGIMGPVVFLSVLSSFISLNNINTLSTIGGKIIKKMILITTTAILVSTLVYLCLFKGEITLFSSFDVSGLFALVLDIFPVNLFKPFVDNVIIQIVIIAGFIGVVMIIMEKCTGVLADGILECSDLSIQMMKVITKLTPVMIGLSVFKLVSVIDLNNVIPVVKIIAAIYLASALLIILYLALYKVKTKKSVLTLLKNGKEYGLKAFVIGSGSAVISQLFEISEKQKMDQKFAKFYIPMSLALTSTGNTVFLVCSAFFMTEITGNVISISWLICMAVLCFELTIATPGGSGGVLVTVSVLASQLGIGDEYLGLLSAVQILTTNFIAAQGAMIRYITLAEMNETEMSGNQ